MKYGIRKWRGTQLRTHILSTAVPRTMWYAAETGHSVFGLPFRRFMWLLFLCSARGRRPAGDPAAGAVLDEVLLPGAEGGALLARPE